MAVAHPVTVDEPRERAHPLSGRPSSPVVGALLAVSIAVTLVLLYALWKFWPTADVLKSESPSPVHVFGMERLVTPEIRLFVVVALAGALGGLLHSTRSFAWYVGHRGLVWRWVPYYVVTIVIGAGLATIVYVVIRGGLFSGSTATADTNPYGFVAIAAIVGLFTEQALEMLRNVATHFFAEAPEGADGAAAVAGDPAGSPEPVLGLAAITAETLAADGLGPDGAAASTKAIEPAPPPGASVTAGE